nr:hypothetical protein [uncultured Lacibacter sp.]
MKRSMFCLCFVFAAMYCAAQKPGYYTIQPGENIMDVVPKNELFEYEQFQPGYVQFKNGARSQARLNYSYIHEKVMFISPKGDTLLISNPSEVSVVSFEKGEYYYADNRYVKLDTVIGNARIGIVGFYVTLNKKKIGGYGLATEGGADSYGSFAVPSAVGQNQIKFIPNVITNIAFRKALFIGDRFNRFVVATKKNVLSMYADKETLIKAYLESNKVDFTSKNDVIRLLEHIEK